MVLITPPSGGMPEEAALEGIRVVEIARGIAGPFASRLLAEAGADVVKVEPQTGDPSRTQTPAGFASWNRSKRSVALSLDETTDRETLGGLLARADVLLHDLPRPAAEALGIDEATLAARHRHLVVVSVPPYPLGHPRDDVAANETLVQAAEGFMDEQQGNREGPVFVRIPYASWSAGYLAAAGAVARLVQRFRTGEVLPVSTSLFQGALATAALYWQRWERLPSSLTKHTLPKIDPDAALSIFECSDRRWIQLAGAVGGWIESPPVLEALALQNLVELSEVGVSRANQETWNEIFRQHTSEWWRDTLSDHDVPCMIVHELGECFTHEQSIVNDYVVEVDDPVVGTALQAGPPVHTTPRSRVLAPAPYLGSTNVDDLLGEWDARPVPTVPGTPEPANTRPLTGLRALDFGSAIAGPFGAQCLVDLGAEVVKVEPISGDRGRQLTQFAGAHRAKRSLSIDLKSAGAQPVLEALVRSSDIVLHNMRLGPAGRLGLDGPGLRSVNPGIVFSHVSAYGPEGEMAAYPGYDPTAQALTGWEHANAGEGMRPLWLRNSVFDVHAGLASCFGAMVGLLQKVRTGVPGEAATSLLAVGITASSELVVDASTGSRTQVDVLDAAQTGVSATHRIYQLADGWIAVAALDAAEQEAFWQVVGGRDVLPEKVLAERGVGPALADLESAGVPCALVRIDQLDGFHDEPAHRSLGLSRRLETHDFGTIDLVGGFWSFGPAAPDESVPSLGEQSLEILSELGCSAAQVADLIASRTVHAGAHGLSILSI